MLAVDRDSFLLCLGLSDVSISNYSFCPLVARDLVSVLQQNEKSKKDSLQTSITNYELDGAPGGESDRLKGTYIRDLKNEELSPYRFYYKLFAPFNSSAGV